MKLPIGKQNKLLNKEIKGKQKDDRQPASTKL